MNYLKKIDEIMDILQNFGEEELIEQINDAKVMGGTGGEILSIICSLFKTYEIQQLRAFDLIQKETYELYEYAKSIGLHPAANILLIKELQFGLLTSVGGRIYDSNKRN